ncbi:MAG: hypothetical protein KF823_06995 [Xanthomonadales bacterium]|nr:hypothetical protein [Xanthomonadales bacterium]
MAINRLHPSSRHRAVPLWSLALLGAGISAAGAADPHAVSLQQGILPLPAEIAAPARSVSEADQPLARPGIRFERTVSIAADGTPVYGCRQSGGHDFRAPRQREHGEEQQR